jgi:hypothetical protein
VPHLLSYRSMPLLLAAFVVSHLAFSGPLSSQMTKPDVELQVSALPAITAATPHSSDVLESALATVLHDPEICCGKDSALQDSVATANPKSLKDVAAKLEGRHLLSDGRPIKVLAQYLTPDQLSSGHLIAMMLQQHAPLMQWNSHVYVVHGIVYFQTVSANSDAPGLEENVIRKFLLWDTRYSDSRREVVFDRSTTDAGQIQGLLFLDSKLQ